MKKYIPSKVELALTLFFFIISISSVSAATIYVDPTSNSGGTDSTFTVYVKASASDLDAYQFNLTWNKNVLDCIGAKSNQPWTNFLIVMDEVNQGNYFAASSDFATSSANPLIGFTGTTTLAQITFRVKNAESSALALSDILLLNSAGGVIPYSKTDGYYQSQTGGGQTGGGCPILKVNQDNKLVTIGKLNIHSPKDQDTIATSTFNMQPVNGKYEIILDEAAYLFWDGSHINSVKLTDGTGKECNMISATHSKQGDVLSAIATSDNVRVRSYPGERITLTYDDCSGNQFTFSIEGYNRKTMVTESLAAIMNFFKNLFGLQ